MRGLTNYVIRRILFMIPVFLGVTILTFIVTNAAGNPIDIIRIGLRRVPPQLLEALERYYHIDKPIYIRYLYWLWDVLHLNLGRSLTGARVIDKIGPWIMTTLELQIPAILLFKRVLL